MTLRPVVVKLGGDALATPARIVAQARRLARAAQAGPVVAVASARRGVTDQLLSLVREVGPDGNPEADRALAAGEVVSAALLALALGQLGVPARSLDARDAGIECDGEPGAGRIRRIRTGRVAGLLRRGVVPVIAGFQGWHRGRIRTLGRGGSDLSAVALAVALGAERCELVKEAPGLFTADPRLVPAARHLPRTGHRFLRALAGAGSRVIHAPAAGLAARYGLPLAFLALEGDAAHSLVTALEVPGLRAVAARDTGNGRALVTALGEPPGSVERQVSHLIHRLEYEGLPVLGWNPAPLGVSLAVPGGAAGAAASLLHRVHVEEQLQDPPAARLAS